jgi:hypothetical protein
VLQELLDLLEHKVLQELLDLLEHKVLPELLDLLEHKVLPELLDLEVSTLIQPQPDLLNLPLEPLLLFRFLLPSGCKSVKESLLDRVEVIL